MSPSKTISIHQPNFLPWPGYFEKIQMSDTFVLLDSAEYTKNSFINRNKIMISGQPHWLTLPINYHGNSKSPINKIRLHERNFRPDKIIKKLTQEYRGSVHFESTIQEFSEILLDGAQHLSLSQLNESLIYWVCNKSRIETEIIRSSKLQVTTKDASQSIVDICLECRGTRYLSGIGGKKYLKEELFENAGIEIAYMTTPSLDAPEYYLSVLHWILVSGDEFLNEWRS